MTPSKHTPGAVALHVRPEIGEIDILLDHPKLGPQVKVGALYIDNEPGALPQHEAETLADLFAAAPDMLTALKDCEQSLARLPDTDGAFRVTVLQMVRKAIAKAEGRP